MNEEYTNKLKCISTPSQSHMVVCSLCKRDGHLKKDCPEDFKKVKLDPLPPVTPEFLCVLDKVCEQCYSEYGLNVFLVEGSNINFN